MALAAACGAQADPEVRIGDPLPGLSAAELARFEEGGRLFRHIFAPEEGLGPLFNANACNACHTTPADGGTGDQFVVKATRFTPPDECDLLTAVSGENVRQFATPALQAHGVFRDEIPPEATHVARFDVTFVFGSGLVDAIPDAALLELAAREDVGGRAGRDAAGRVARFGRKAAVATLHEFVHIAAHQEMGLTTSRFPREHGPNGRPLPPGTDPADNPELDDAAVQLLVDFVRFLAPPPRERGRDADEQAVIDAGEAVFHRIGCTSCHVPSLRTGPHPVPAIDRRDVHLYSDLLLHDLGPDLANVCAPGATPTELRTELLMGLRFRRQFLHDGRAASVADAIELHGGEAATARQAFRDLSAREHLALLRFLDSL